MSIAIVLIVVIISLLFAKWLWSRRRFYSIYAKLPGPLGLPFIGQGFQVRNAERVLTYMDKLSKEYKTPFILWMGTECCLYVNDPATVETIFQSSSCTNKGNIYRFLADIIGDGLFTSSSPRWNKHRRLLNPAFGRRTVETYLPIFNREVNSLIKKLTQSENQSLELFELLKKTILEVACQTTMGQKMNFNDDKSIKIFDSFTSILEVGAKRLLSPWLYPNVIYRFSGAKKIEKEATAVLFRFVENLLRGQKNDLKTPLAESTSDDESTRCSPGYPDDDDIKTKKPKVFIEYVKSYIQSGQFTFEDARDEANVAMGAAFETTSTTLYFVCLCLAMHPEHQDKLYNELVELFPANDKELDVTLDHLEHMTYTQMVINEAMRLYAPVPTVLRSASADFQLSDGTRIPHGTQIVIDIFNMQRSEKVWGPYARSFDPERHFGATNEQHPYAFIPFTKGMRMCIGYRYAVMLMKIIVAKIFRNFRVHIDAKMSDLVIRGTISLKLSHYPLVTFQTRG